FFGFVTHHHVGPLRPGGERRSQGVLAQGPARQPVQHFRVLRLEARRLARRKNQHGKTVCGPAFANTFSHVLTPFSNPGEPAALKFAFLVPRSSPRAASATRDTLNSQRAARRPHPNSAPGEVAPCTSRRFSSA